MLNKSSSTHTQNFSDYQNRRKQKTIAAIIKHKTRLKMNFFLLEENRNLANFFTTISPHFKLNLSAIERLKVGASREQKKLTSYTLSLLEKDWFELIFRSKKWSVFCSVLIGQMGAFAG